MKPLLLSLLLATACAVTSYGQTIKTLGFNTTNGQVVYAGTNLLTFTNPLFVTSFAQGNLAVEPSFEDDGLGLSIIRGTNEGIALLNLGYIDDSIRLLVPLSFDGTNAAATTRTNLGLGATWLTNTNVTNFRTAIGLGATNSAVFQNLQLGTDFLVDGNTGTISWNTNNYIILEEGRIGTGVPSVTNDVFVWGPTEVIFRSPINFSTNSIASTTRTNLSLPLPALTNTSNVTMMRALADSTNTNAPFSGSVSVVGTNNTNVLVFTNGILLEVQ
jgi:hypothetical protein